MKNSLLTNLFISEINRFLFFCKIKHTAAKKQVFNLIKIYFQLLTEILINHK